MEKRPSNYMELLTRLPSMVGARNNNLLPLVRAGLREGRNPETIIAEIVEWSGNPPMKRVEVTRAVSRVLADKSYIRDGGGFSRGFCAPPAPVPGYAEKAAAYVGKMLSVGEHVTDFGWLSSLSPEKIPEDLAAQTRLFLVRTFREDEFVFVGMNDSAGRIGATIRRCSEWIKAAGGEMPGEKMIVNPLTGREGRTGEGKLSFRADSNVSCPRYAVIEFDGMSLEEQCRFFGGVVLSRSLRLHSVTYSGGKSLHGLIETGLQSAGEWSALRTELKAFLSPQGAARERRADSACFALSRLSRLAGRVRADNGEAQRLLWLA